MVHEAGGCERCGGTGYRGRSGVFEMLEMTGEVRKLIGPQTDANMLDQARDRPAGMTTMLDGRGRQMPRRRHHRAARRLRVTTVR